MSLFTVSNLLARSRMVHFLAKPGMGKSSSMPMLAMKWVKNENQSKPLLYKYNIGSDLDYGLYSAIDERFLVLIQMYRIV